MPARSTRPKQPLPPMLVLALSLIVTALVTHLAALNVETKERERFENSVQVARDDIHTRMSTYINTLRSTAALFAATDVTRTSFTGYVRALAIRSRYPGYQGIGYAVRLSPDQEEALERRERKTRPGFDIHPDGPRPEMTAILWLLPEDKRNLHALGYDMFSDPVRRVAMERARDSGNAAASAKVTLVQEIDQDRQSGFLIYTPVYRGGVDPLTVETRRRALIGYVYSPFRATDLFRGIFGSQEHPRLDLDIYDGPSRDADAALRRSGGRLPPGYRPRFRETRRLEVAGRTWTLVFATRPEFDLASQGGMVTLVGLAGLLISFLLFAIVQSQTRGREAAEHLAAELRESEEALRAASRAKDEFLAMLGHELRNPLAAVNNSLALLRLHVGDDPKARRALQTAERQLRHQTRLVDDLLDVSRVTSGKISLRKERLDLAEIVRATAETLRVRAEGRQQRFTVQVEPQPLWMDADSVRLEQILVNLITNAIKYTPPQGEICVSALREGSEGVIRVLDTGKGIPPEMLEPIFDMFAQGPTTTARSEGGLGLGLTLVRALVQLHGGDVMATSEGAGRGSEFAVRLPLAPVTADTGAEARPPTADGQGEPKRVVIVEDNPDARETLQELLEVWGHEVRTADEGGKGLELILDTAPEVAIVDIGLPVMDGYEVARRVRAAGLPTHLVAVTGYGQPEDRRRSADAGFDRHLVKPVDPEQLEQVLHGI